MEKKLQSYETLFVVDTTKGEEATKAVIEKFTTLIANNGEITQVNDWNKRRLAYPINDLTEGHYTLVYFKAEPSFASELERLYNINENILRAIVLKEDEKVKHTAPEAPQAKVEEEEAAPAEEKAEEVVEAAEETAEEVTEAVEETAEEVTEAVEETVEETVEAAEEATEAPADAE